MDEYKVNKYTIDFTDEDMINLYKKQIVDWWVSEAHPEILIRAEKLAKEMISQQNIDSDKSVDAPEKLKKSRKKTRGKKEKKVEHSKE